MAYLSKQTIVESLQCIKNVETQVAIPCFSALQYFIAMDRYYHSKEIATETSSNNHDSEGTIDIYLNGSSKDSKKVFISYVSDVISFDDGSYLKSFKELYTGNKGIQGTIQSNFFGGSSVEISRSSSEKVVYPQQGNTPLIYAFKGNVYRDEALYKNLQSYLTTQESRFALAIWLLRRNGEIQDISIETLREKLSDNYTQLLVDTLLPLVDISFDKLKESIELDTSNSIAYISKSDFTMVPNASNNQPTYSLQQIFYGAPGTGKSNEIKKITKDFEKEGRVFRTTFHPDSDYSTFVGAFKPSMKIADRIYSSEELAVKLKEIKNSGVTYPCHKFAAQYWKSLKDLNANTIKEILTACGFTDAYSVEVAKGVAIGQDYLNKEEDGKIIYAFTPQAFTRAYTAAWNTTEDVYLIIEEINRGNCAQIFGDLFQLLDRGDDGFSEYPINADNDLGKYIAKELENSIRTDFPDGVKDGKKLVLPKNLYIWATMNTSDQSLFPIDSAFKRRWDWRYMKIKNEGKEWKIDVKIKDADGVEKLVDWWGFIRKVNDIIASMTSSADKQLGYFFCKADKKTQERASEPNSKNDLISVDTFVSKVLFYLWNDVFKDYGFEDASLFQYKDNEGKVKDLTFPDFFKEDSNDVNPTMVTDFVQKVMNWKKKEEEKN